MLKISVAVMTTMTDAYLKWEYGGVTPQGAGFSAPVIRMSRQVSIH